MFCFYQFFFSCFSAWVQFSSKYDLSPTSDEKVKIWNCFAMPARLGVLRVEAKSRRTTSRLLTLYLYYCNFILHTISATIKIRFYLIKDRILIKYCFLLCNVTLTICVICWHQLGGDGASGRSHHDHDHPPHCPGCWGVDTVADGQMYHWHTCL